MLKTVGLPGELDLQNLDVDNININGNTISSTNTNGNIDQQTPCKRATQVGTRAEAAGDARVTMMQ